MADLLYVLLALAFFAHEPGDLGVQTIQIRTLIVHRLLHLRTLHAGLLSERRLLGLARLEHPLDRVDPLDGVLDGSHSRCVRTRDLPQKVETRDEVREVTHAENDVEEGHAAGSVDPGSAIREGRGRRSSPCRT